MCVYCACVCLFLFVITVEFGHATPSWHKSMGHILFLILNAHRISDAILIERYFSSFFFFVTVIITLIMVKSSRSLIHIYTHNIILKHTLHVPSTRLIVSRRKLIFNRPMTLWHKIRGTSSFANFIRRHNHVYKMCIRYKRYGDVYAFVAVALVLDTSPSLSSTVWHRFFLVVTSSSLCSLSNPRAFITRETMCLFNVNNNMINYPVRIRLRCVHCGVEIKWKITEHSYFIYYYIIIFKTHKS